MALKMRSEGVRSVPRQTYLNERLGESELCDNDDERSEVAFDGLARVQVLNEFNPSPRPRDGCASDVHSQWHTTSSRPASYRAQRPHTDYLSQQRSIQGGGVLLCGGDCQKGAPSSHLPC